MAITHLVLFDIDGTLLSTNGDGVRAMMEAYAEVWNCQPESIRYSMSGKTERQISHELLGLLGFSREEVESGLPRFFQRYPQALRRHLSPERLTVHPGIRPLVKTLQDDPQTVLGLLTGNCEAAAEIKLEVADLEGFAVGAYGEFHEDRAELPPVAVQAARNQYGREFTDREVVIIGDTPNDILCARAVGAKSIAVATGRQSMEDLAAHRPDFLFRDFSKVDAVLRAIQAG